MRQIEISESVFRDLISCKSKIDDILDIVEHDVDKIPKQKLIDKLRRIVYSGRYLEIPEPSTEENGNDGCEVD